MNSTLQFRCPRCPFFAPRYTRVVLHLQNEHSLEPTFFVTCGIEGCQRKYKIMESFRKHLYRHHQRWISTIECESRSDLPHSSDQDDPVDAGDSSVGASSSSVQAESAPGSPQGTCVEEASDRFSLQRFISDMREWIAKLFFYLAEKQKVPYTTCEKLFRDIEVLLQSSLRRFAEYIKQELVTCCNAVPEPLTRVFDCAFLQGMFDGIRSQYQRTEYAKATLPYTEPQQCSYADDDRASFQYISIAGVLQNFARCKDVFMHLTDAEAAETGILRSFRDGTVCRKQIADNLAVENETLVHLLLYSDELEIANPLGAARGMHKLFVVFYSILNIHPRYRSQLRLLHVAIIAKYPDVQKHGLAATLKPLLLELNELQSNGINVSSNGKDICLKVSILACSGDNLSMNRLGGFACSFSHGSVCRFCTAQASQLPTLTREDLCQVRTKELHESHLSAVELNPALYRRLYGVNAQSAMSCLGNFDPTSQLPPDIMHDLFEGVFPFVVQHTLKGLLQAGILSESDLERITTFKYGCNDRTNRPPELTVSLLQHKGTMKGTASQKWCLFRLLPQILASSIPEENVNWEVYLLLREVADILLADEIPAHALAYLVIKIQEFIRAFVACYPNVRLIPKLHYLIHYPRMISFFGPLKQVWCMRFEAKHQYFKNIATRVKNFRNISKTLAERHQLLQSYEFSELVFDEAPTMTGLKLAERSELPPCVHDVLPAGTTWQAKSATMLHVTYHVGDILVMHKGDEPQFSQINSILTAENEVVLLLEKMELVEFRRHRYAFKVAKTGEVCVARPGDEAVPDCLDLYFGGEVVPRCEVVLLN